MTLKAARTSITRVFSPPPHIDGLDATIAMFAHAREWSLDCADACLQDHGAGGEVIVSLPAAALDGVILELESARRYRNDLHRTRRLWMTITIAAVVLNLASVALNLLLMVVRR